MLNEPLAIAIGLIAAYFLGSIPTAYIVGRLRKGIDIRQVGSRNMGAMNVFYNVGFLYGLLVLLTDIGKGAAAVALARWLEVPIAAELIAGAIAVLGHSFPVWLRFRGGKGGAPLIGVFVFLMPWGLAIAFPLFALLALLTRFPTLSYSLALLTFPFVAWLIYHDGIYIIYSILMLLIPFIRYIPRIKEMRTRGGSWKHVVLRRNIKDRL
ncbi:MAG: glycerol-3-phosphate acyltransferase [Dehalococcoidales bacterium]|nr:glycerol-3-phosphate acyltransferase [Dehalococcoidales bacterium]